MPKSNSSKPDSNNRRQFIATTATATAAASMVHTSTAQAQEKLPIRIGIIGCGGRGTGALQDSFSINDGVKVVAAADLYSKKCTNMRTLVGRKYPDHLDIADDRIYEGLDGYKRILDAKDIDLVILTTSPGFRPYHIMEAVEAGKHVFAEKPTCVDPAGYRVCLEAHELAEKNHTAIVTGTQYRRQTNFVGAVEEIRKGTIGDIVHAETRYCSGGIWYRGRKDEMSDAEYQLNNWMHFIWLSGDQITEQAVHNIDAMNWVMGSPPESVYGSGGRFTRPEDSEMWDNMELDYYYPGGKTLSFMCRQLPNTEFANGSIIYGTEGNCHIGAFSSGSYITDRKGNKTWEMAGSLGDAYKMEHKELVDSIRAGSPIVELKQTADSSLTAVMGRMAAYTGKRVTWDFVTKESKLDLFPKDLTWDGEMPEPKFAVPGQTKLV